MVRDIVKLPSKKSLVTEYLSEDRVRVIGENALLNKTAVHFDNGPSYKIGQRSNFRGLNKVVENYFVEYQKENTVSVLLELGD